MAPEEQVRLGRDANLVSFALGITRATLNLLNLAISVHRHISFTEFQRRLMIQRNLHALSIQDQADVETVAAATSSRTSSIKNESERAGGQLQMTKTPPRWWRACCTPSAEGMPVRFGAIVNSRRGAQKWHQLAAKATTANVPRCCPLSGEEMDGLALDIRGSFRLQSLLSGGASEERELGAKI